MREVRIDRLSRDAGDLILQGMENREYRFPTSAELYAIERAARRMRAAEMARLLRSMAAALKSVVARVAAPSSAKGIRHA
jgi:hypothetical protein